MIKRIELSNALFVTKARYHGSDEYIRIRQIDQITGEEKKVILDKDELIKILGLTVIKEGE